MKFGLLSKYFPSPQFLKPPHIGISFSDSNIKAILFDKTQKEPSLKSVIVPIEKGGIVEGKIVDIESVIKALSTVRSSFDSSFVFFAIPDELTFVFTTSVSVGPKSNPAESIAFVMEENVPLSLGEVIFDFVPTEIIKSDLEYEASFVVSVCVKKEVEKLIEALQKVGFETLGCIHESQAIANAIVKKDFSDTLSIIHARENRVGIYLVKNNIVHFSTLREASGATYKKQFLDEYEKFLDYSLKYGIGQNKSVKSVLICGEFQYTKEILEAINDSSKIDNNVTLSNVWSNVFEIDKHMPGIPYEKSLSFAGPIGGVLSDVS
ncbi:MAG: hypothetical protein A3A90_02425 [Candidatus Zambryskibacteria bacterium RIFCSPLOWO2_01_FULL_35_19]|uniref:SHS2 domain-containing protein n=1 Tax=Candidatus Zambryskibacteria bacterium RIFCSPLOWO2_01_FULL_35_19 TaxID=1802757 RepID=A0A1G2TZW5_9BACT|nr:MAG: hypothetical protein A2726_02565 [Candidatus Zambryskibacteria bacterium RIFCSPHIGHO2_01_FULL_35_32]OHB02092.1 MAG: hypothetical protein A3A90_02425 [Candidatus Zambryskibacteria bacterium RIFCSPLOWO2_01_FULL_35_19]